MAAVFQALGFGKDHCVSPPALECVQLYEQASAANSAMLRAEAGLGDGDATRARPGLRLPPGRKFPSH